MKSSCPTHNLSTNDRIRQGDSTGTIVSVTLLFNRKVYRIRWDGKEVDDPIPYLDSSIDTKNWVKIN